MQGSVRKRGSTWSYRFDMGTIDGKRQRKEKGGFDTKKEAEAALAKALNEYNTAGLYFEPSTMTVSDYLDFWFDEFVKKNCKPNTCRGYKNIIDHHIKPALGHYRLKALTPAAVQKWVNSLKTETGLAKSMVQKCKGVLTNSLGYAVVPMGYLQSNPAIYARIPAYANAPKEEQRDAITVQQFNDIAEHFKNTPCYVPLMIGFYTGMRIGEVFGLCWDDIDLDNKIIHVRHTAIHISYDSDLNPCKGADGLPWFIGTPKTASSFRDIDIGDTLCKCLKEAKKEQHRQRFQYGENYSVNYFEPAADTKGDPLLHIVTKKRDESSDGLAPADLVCIQKNGKYYNLISLNTRVNPYVVYDMGIKFDFHTLRHTHGTLLAAAGIAPKIIQERLGHSEIDVTMNTYVHNTEDKRKEAARVFEAIS